jgi:hypothetical protein
VRRSVPSSCGAPPIQAETLAAKICKYFKRLMQGYLYLFTFKLSRATALLWWSWCWVLYCYMADHIPVVISGERERLILILWRIGPSLGNGRNAHAANNTGQVFSVLSAPCPVLGNASIDTRSDCRRGVFYVVCVMPSTGQRANRHAIWHVTCVFCAAWSVPRLYKGESLKYRENQDNENKKEYNGVQQGEKWVVGRR